MLFAREPLPARQIRPEWRRLRTGRIPAAAAALSVSGVIGSACLGQVAFYIGSRPWGSIYSPGVSTGAPNDLVTGPDILTSQVRGFGPSIASPGGHFSLLPIPTGNILVRTGAWSEYGLYRVDPASGDRELLPGTSAPLWASTSEMLLWDPGTVLVVADDFVAAASGGGVATDDAKILRYDLATGATTIVSSSTVGDGVVMFRPRAMVRLDAGSIAVAEVGAISLSGSDPGMLLYRVDIATGNRTVLSSIGWHPAWRRTSTGGVPSPTGDTVPPRGTGPTFTVGVRGMAIVGGRIFIGGTVEDNGTYDGGIIEVNAVSGDRTLRIGTALDANGGRLHVAPGPGSTTLLPSAPTSLQAFDSTSIAFCATFGPNSIWRYEFDDNRLTPLVNLTPGVENAGFTALAVIQSNCNAATLQIDQQPTDVTACGGQPTALEVSAAGTGPIAYEWYVACPAGSGPWVSVSDGLNQPFGVGACGFVAVGASGPELTVQFQNLGTLAAAFRCTVSNQCLSRTSDEAIVTECRADFNCSGARSVQDIFDFLEAYFSGDPRADFNNSSQTSVQDIFDFLEAYFAGCA